MEEPQFTFVNHKQMPVYLSVEDFETNMADPRSNLAYGELGNVISQPNEVYMQKNEENGAIEMRVIKFYSNGAIVAIVDYADIVNMQLKNWYIVYSEQIKVNGKVVNAIDNERRGILLANFQIGKSIESI